MNRLSLAQPTVPYFTLFSLESASLSNCVAIDFHSGTVRYVRASLPGLVGKMLDWDTGEWEPKRRWTRKQNGTGTGCDSSYPLKARKQAKWLWPGSGVGSTLSSEIVGQRHSPLCIKDPDT